MIAVKYTKPNNIIAVPISSSHIFISNLHYDITIQDQIQIIATNVTTPKIPSKISILLLYIAIAMTDKK